MSAHCGASVSLLRGARPEGSLIAIACRIFMNEQLQWTLQATCSVCQAETTLALHMGVLARCDRCHALIKIDPRSTVFHRASGSGYWAG